MLPQTNIRRFVALDMHVSACNLHCGYCYVPTSKKTEAFIPDYTMQLAALNKAFSVKTLGGISFIYVYANGEPLLPQGSVSAIRGFLAQGHYVGVVSNLTHAQRVRELCEMPADYSERLVVLASLHYHELKRHNLLGMFFSHVHKIRRTGASCIVRLCLAPDYIHIVDELKQSCLEQLGELPVITHYKDHRPIPVDIEATLDLLAQQFPSTVYQLQKQISDVKRREFCHAGEWSYAIDFYTGDVRRCLFEPVCQNIYDTAHTPLAKRPVGHECRAPWCTCGAHYLSWGVIEEFDCPHYADMLSCYSQHTLSEQLQRDLSHKLPQTNK